MAREINSGDVEIKVEDSDDEGRDPSKRAPKKVADPKMPTEAEAQKHDRTRLPYLSWCVYSVRGRGEQTGHRGQDPRPENATPEIDVEYCFMGRMGEDARAHTCGQRPRHADDRQLPRPEQGDGERPYR